MQVRKTTSPVDGAVSWEVIDDAGQPIPEVSAFLGHLHARGYSPNTLSAYAYDLQHFTRFLVDRGLTYAEFTPPRSLDLLEYLRALPARRPVQHLGLVRCDVQDGHPVRRLAAPTINRILASISSFYEYFIVAGQFSERENPILQVEDPALARVADRHRPFMGGASRQHPLRRAIRVRTVERLPRPLAPDQIEALLASLRCWRDKAIVLLMLQGGLRPGEVLNLQLEDLQYGRRRVTIRYRTDHPKGARTKSRTERVVDLHEPDTLRSVSTYVMTERPQDTTSPYLFLVGGHGKRRHEPLSYSGLVRMFQRHCARLGIRTPWLTPHALRHTHATAMFEQGMRELTLQKRLGHKSVESTRVYTRVADRQVVAEYQAALGEADQP